MLYKLKELGYKLLRHLPYSPNLSPTDYHFFKHLNNFLQGNHFQNQQEAENAFQEFVKSWIIDFYAIGVCKLIFCWKKCVDWMIPILINTDVFERSYKDLNFTVWNPIAFAPT